MKRAIWNIPKCKKKKKGSWRSVVFDWVDVWGVVSGVASGRAVQRGNSAAPDMEFDAEPVCVTAARGLLRNFRVGIVLSRWSTT